EMTDKHPVVNLRLFAHRNFRIGTIVLVLGYAGLWGGYQSLFVRRLSDQTVFILLSNRMNVYYGDVGNLLQKIDSSSTVKEIK
ncbi:MAG: hypothetical protein ACRCUT_13115, partial [Spirochaetota bacterium]